MAGKGKTQSSKMPEAGDMVEFPRKPGYSHYGIADGKGNVIHATSDYGESGSMIKKELLTNVATNGNFKVNNTQDHIMTPLEGKTIVSRAEKRLGQKFRYNPETNNCETFASEMRYGDGKGFSEQGEWLAKKAENHLKTLHDDHNHFTLDRF